MSDAACVLRVSQPTVRSWLDAGVLGVADHAAPARVDVVSLATAKRAVDLLRERGQDRNLLIAVMRLLRDRAALAGGGVREGFENLAARQNVPLTDALLDELAAPLQWRKRSREVAEHSTPAWPPPAQAPCEPQVLTFADTDFGVFLARYGTCQPIAQVRILPMWTPRSATTVLTNRLKYGSSPRLSADALP